MKTKTLLIILTLFILTGVSSVYSYMALQNIYSNYNYSISFNGGKDAKILEFTPKSDKNITCVAISINNGGGISCFSKNKEQLEKENIPGN